MKIRCSYCNAYILDTAEKCFNCGALNDNKIKYIKTTPCTVEELQKWYQDHNLPPKEITRFFISENYQGPRAYGIYKNEKNNFVVYQNKEDGSRYIRYEGNDEAYAVNELYMKLNITYQNVMNKRK